MNSPVRGNYDGLVVLAAVTKDMMPTKDLNDVSGLANSTRKNLDPTLDHEYYCLALETGLSNHFMFSELEYSARCVVGNKAAAGMGDAISVTLNPADFGGKRDQAAKHPGYVVYVAYRQVHCLKNVMLNYVCDELPHSRLTPYTAYSHGAALSQLKLVTRPLSQAERQQQIADGKIPGGSEGQVLTPLLIGASPMHLTKGKVNSAGLLQQGTAAESATGGAVASSAATAVMRIGQFVDNYGFIFIATMIVGIKIKATITCNLNISILKPLNIL